MKTCGGRNTHTHTRIPHFLWTVVIPKNPDFARRTATGTRYSVVICTDRDRLLSKTLKIKIYRTIILPIVLYGCETWSLTLREERRLWVFENRVLRRVFGPMSDEVTGEWRKLHNEELRDLYSLHNIVWVVKSRRIRWAGHVSRMGRGEVCRGF